MRWRDIQFKHYKQLPHGDKGWIGFDLDGTAAEYHGWINPLHVGKPIPKVIALIKRYLAEGYEVRIFTARACSGALVRDYIRAWCKKHIGVPLEVTNQKDYRMVAYFDDRAVQVIKNTGETVGIDAQQLLKPDTPEYFKFTANNDLINAARLADGSFITISTNTCEINHVAPGGVVPRTFEEITPILFNSALAATTNKK